MIRYYTDSLTCFVLVQYFDTIEYLYTPRLLTYGSCDVCVGTGTRTGDAPKSCPKQHPVYFHIAMALLKSLDRCRHQY